MLVCHENANIFKACGWRGRVNQQIKLLPLLDPTSSYLCVFSVSGVDNGGAADLRQLLAMSIERPQTNFIGANHVLDEQNSSTESQRQAVKKLNVL